jgi:hypothetical protein
MAVVGMVRGRDMDMDRDKRRRSIRLFNSNSSLINKVVWDMVLVGGMEGASMWTSRISSSSSSNNNNMLDSSNRHMLVSWLGSKCMRWETGVIP